MKRPKENNAGFKVPKGYFEEFDERLKQQIETERPKVSAGFTVPENYFRGVEESILGKLKASRKATGVRRLYPYWIPAAAVAASVAVLVTVLTLPRNTVGNDTLTPLAIEDYIHDHFVDFDTYDISPLLSEKTLSDIYYEGTSLSEENLTDYLLEHIDETTLITD